MRKALWPLGLLAGSDHLAFREGAHIYNLRERLKALLRTDVSIVNPRGGVVTGLAVTANVNDVDVALGSAIDVNGEHILVETDPSSPADGGPTRPDRVSLSPGAGTTRYLYVKAASIENQNGETFRDGFAADDTRSWDSYEFVWSDYDPDDPSAPDETHIPLAAVVVATPITEITDLRPALVLGRLRYEPLTADLAHATWLFAHEDEIGGAAAAWENVSWLPISGLLILQAMDGNIPRTGPGFFNLSADGNNVVAVTGPSWLRGVNATQTAALDKFLIPWSLPEDLHIVTAVGDTYTAIFEVLAVALQGLTDTAGKFRLGARVVTAYYAGSGASGNTYDSIVSDWFNVDIDDAPAWCSFTLDLDGLGVSPGDAIQFYIEGDTTNGFGNVAFVHARVRAFRDLRSAVRIGL